MTDTYNDALGEQMKKNVWDRLKDEATSMSKLEYATVTADIAGIFDPTPVSDAAGLLLSVVQRDALGALLSLGSMIPYAGDAVAKPLKIAKYAPRTAKAIKAMLKASDDLAGASAKALKKTGLSLDQVAKARKDALEVVQQAMVDARKKLPGCEPCRLVSDAGRKRRLQMPQTGKNGSWDTPGGVQPENGSGVFQFTSAKELPDKTKVTSIEFNNGAPVFDDYLEGPKYELWSVSGNAKVDGDRLKAMMQAKDPSWRPPNKKKFVLHHLEDGSVAYVPRAIHDVGKQGVAHTGGNSMINNKLF